METYWNYIILSTVGTCYHPVNMSSDKSHLFWFQPCNIELADSDIIKPDEEKQSMPRCM
jgi:hypothetical protein